ncbi:MAG: hypothetical protein ACOYB3_01990 [Azonexus sp.]
MVIVLSVDQEATLRQMAADLDLPPSDLLVHLVSDRLESQRLSLWGE